MKKLFGVHIVALILCTIVFSSCLKDLESEGVYKVTNCNGTVLDERTQQPIPNIRIIVTDGIKTSTIVNTAFDGTFNITVTVEELGTGYYLHLDSDSLYEPIDVSLKNIALGVKTYKIGSVLLKESKAPVVATDTVAAITASTAHCKGLVSDEGTSAVIERGFVFSTMQNPAINDYKVPLGAGLGSFEGTLNGLSVNTTYYVRAYARNGSGIGYGEQRVFTTLDGLPTVRTEEVDNITPIAAECGGTVLEDGGFAVTAKGVCWSTTSEPTLDNAHSSDGNGLGSFVSHLANLEPGKTYYVRAYAKNAAGVAYGAQYSFTTKDGLPTVSTQNISNVTTTTAICGGTISEDGGFTILQRGVCYSTTPNPSTDSPHTSDGRGSGTFVSQLAGLSPHTTYYVRAYATNCVGTVYGEQKTFATE